MAPKASSKVKATIEEPSDEQKEGTSKSLSPERAIGASSESSASGSEHEPEEEDKPDDSAAAPAAPTSSNEASQWQAVWAPQYNAYYFYNASTHETTWSNPLQPEASSSTSAAAAAPAHTEEGTAAQGLGGNAEASSSTGPALSAVAAKHAALQAAALAQGIDPLLAHLDPTLLASASGSAAVLGDVPTFTAKFNAQTGQFAPESSRTPGHLSEFERAKRMSEFYFDVTKWEEDLAKRGGSIRAEEGDEEDGTGKKRKRPSKKDLERFKEQKKQKKIAKTAWLRT